MFFPVLWKANSKEKTERSEFGMSGRTMHKLCGCRKRKEMTLMETERNATRKYYIVGTPFTLVIFNSRTHTHYHFSRTIELNWLWENYQPFINTYSYGTQRCEQLLIFAYTVQLSLANHDNDGHYDWYCLWLEAIVGCLAVFNFCFLVIMNTGAI